MLDLLTWKKENDLDLFEAVNITSLTNKENRGYPTAILIAKSLPKEYINKFVHGDTDDTIFHKTEHNVDALAEKLAGDIVSDGYRAIAQSENGIGERKEFDVATKTSYLPHKKIAILSGIGWIGKNNLLITERYGSALCMCSILTDLPLKTDKKEIMMPKCGDCNLCVKVCPAQVLHGITWNVGVSRDKIVNVYQCETCLKCLAKCRYSIRYARS
ncbi:4Fe-4S dicluster domain-containing protein [Anaerosporobacter faecicola]|uniref:4Fe-4S dicluster domain-containing protein n=1 Tax=Anaerosporobacter faecicola TaxID=2718714 RepID=UPI00143C77F5|nr:4Fe-4S dicluster domain-containing protein [Anaerosporobacter faecicola]